MSYDLIIIGSGPGGYSAAVRAGQYGLKTAIIEKQQRLGGTCLLVGCIPTKALLHTADMWDFVKHSSDEGIHLDNPKLDYPAVSDRKNKIVTKHSKGIDFLMKKNKVEVIKGHATLKGGGKVDVQSEKGETRTLEAKNIIIATGSEARMIPNLGARCRLSPDKRRDLKLDPGSRLARHHWSRCRGLRVRIYLRPLRKQSHFDGDDAAHRSCRR